MAATWVQGETPPAQNINYASRSATFAGVAFPAGYAIVIVGSDEATVTGVTVDGLPATNLITSTGSRVVSLWAIDIAVSGAKEIVIWSSSNFRSVAISVGHAEGVNVASAATAQLEFGYYSDPHQVGPLNCPPDGFILGGFISLKPSTVSTWVSGTKIVDGPAQTMRFTTGIRENTGVLGANLSNFPGAAGAAVAITGDDATSGPIIADTDGSIVLIGTASGSITSRAFASGTIPIDGYSSASTIIEGASSGTIALDGQVAGAARISGAATGDIGLNGTAQTSARASGQANGVVPIDGQSAAVTDVTGVAAGDVSLGGAASAGSEYAGITAQGVGTIELSGMASGSVDIAAGTVGQIGLEGVGSASAVAAGAVNGVVSLSGIGSALANIRGQGAISIAFHGASKAASSLVGMAAGNVLLFGEGRGSSRASMAPSAARTVIDEKTASRAVRTDAVSRLVATAGTKRAA